MFGMIKKKKLKNEFEIMLQDYGVEINLIPVNIKKCLDEKIDYFLKRNGNKFDLFMWLAKEMVLHIQERSEELSCYSFGDKNFWVTRASFETTISLSNCKKDREEAFFAMAYTRIKNKGLKI